MKKLMIAAAMVCAAAFAQAATVSWAAEWVCDADFGDVDSGNYWLVALGDTADVSGFKVYEDGTFDFGGKSVVNSGANMGAYGNAGSLTVTDSSANGSYYALVVWDGNNVENSGKFGVGVGQVSGIIDDPPTAGEMVLANGSDEYGTYLMVDQDVFALSPTPTPTPTPSPEPTTGLMMLVGLAGLALRRKMA